MGIVEPLQSLGDCPICGETVSTKHHLMYTFLTETIREDLFKQCRSPNLDLCVKLQVRIIKATRKRKPYKWFPRWKPHVLDAMHYMGIFRDYIGSPLQRINVFTVAGVHPAWVDLPFLYILIDEFFKVVDPRWRHYHTYVPSPVLTYPNFESYFLFLYGLPVDPELPPIQAYDEASGLLPKEQSKPYSLESFAPRPLGYWRVSCKHCKGKMNEDYLWCPYCGLPLKG